MVKLRNIIIGCTVFLTVVVALGVGVFAASSKYSLPTEVHEFDAVRVIALENEGSLIEASCNPNSGIIMFASTGYVIIRSQAVEIRATASEISKDRYYITSPQGDGLLIKEEDRWTLIPGSGGYIVQYLPSITDCMNEDFGAIVEHMEMNGLDHE